MEKAGHGLGSTVNKGEVVSYVLVGEFSFYERVICVTLLSVCVFVCRCACVTAGATEALGAPGAS